MAAACCLPVAVSNRSIHNAVADQEAEAEVDKEIEVVHPQRKEEAIVSYSKIEKNLCCSIICVSSINRIVILVKIIFMRSFFF